MALGPLSKYPMLWLVTGICAALLVPALFMDGMFNDGVLYASVSHNYAQGYGTFWEMYFSDTLYPHFHEQPPLLFALQAGFFKFFGDGFYTERIYCLVTAIACNLLILRAWKIITGDRDTAWLPLLFWFIMPVTFWAFTNNVEECTMTVFALLALNAALRAITSSTHALRWWFIAGVWILAAGLTKGIQGTFLLSAPFWCWIILHNGHAKQFIARSAVIALVPVAFVIVAWFTPSIHDSFGQYFSSRFVKTFDNTVADTRTSHFHLLYELLLDTLVVIFLVFVFLIAGRKTPGMKEETRKNIRMICFLLACGFSGILPLLITREQRGFYLLTALPMLVLAAALFVRPMISRFTTWMNNRKSLANSVSIGSAIVLLVVVFFTVQNFGIPKRDADALQTIHEMAAHTGDRTTIKTSVSINDNWGFVSYAQRYHGLSLTDLDNPETEWLLLEKDTPAPEGYAPVSIHSQGYKLYRKKQ